MIGAPALLPAATFPPLAWFQLANREGSTVCVHENYVKQSLRNRIALVDAQGATDLTLPVHRRFAETRSVQDVKFTADATPDLLLKSLRTNCGSTPFFEHYFPEVEEWAHAHLQPGLPWLDAALASTRWACHALGWTHPVVSQSYQDGSGWDDWRPKARWSELPETRYPQVFEDRLGFVAGRSILDVLFHLGPEAPSLPSPHGNSDPAPHRPA